MLNLRLRKEFLEKHCKGTAIDVDSEKKDKADQFLEITYPTRDLFKGIEAIAPKPEGEGRTVVLMGERGIGKSHLIAALYHILHNPQEARQWLEAWAQRLGREDIARLALREGHPYLICEKMSNHRYRFLWDVLFENHQHGSFIRGKWEAGGNPIPSDVLIRELLEKQPVILLLDEFQTWYDSLNEKDKQLAFNFIQILSEIAQERPDLLGLVVSVRNGEGEAYKQLHRLSPVVIDFKTGDVKHRAQERCSMLLHRLFENRAHIDSDIIVAQVKPHMEEYCRLHAIPPSEQGVCRQKFLESYPYAPSLLSLLEEQVLVATDAQESRDLIRILAELYKSCGDKVSLITAADFNLEEKEQGVISLLDSVSNQDYRRLLEIARYNMRTVRESVVPPPPFGGDYGGFVAALYYRWQA